MWGNIKDCQLFKKLATFKSFNLLLKQISQAAAEL